MMSCKNGVRQIIKTPVTVMTFIALTGRFGLIKTPLDDFFGLTRGADNTVWPAQFADGLITLNLIDQFLDIDLHHWTPVRGWKMGCHQYTTASNSTTLESNKSDRRRPSGSFGTETNDVRTLRHTVTCSDNNSFPVSASIMASATPSCFWVMQKHLTFERTMRSMT